MKSGNLSAVVQEIGQPFMGDSNKNEPVVI